MSDEPDSERLETPAGWERRDQALHRVFTFPDFVAAFGFMTQVALLAEAVGHHPDWSNSWNTVTVSLSSHDVGEVTERDVDLANRMNRLLSE